MSTDDEKTAAKDDSAARQQELLESPPSEQGDDVNEEEDPGAETNALRFLKTRYRLYRNFDPCKSHQQDSNEKKEFLKAFGLLPKKEETIKSKCSIKNSIRNECCSPVAQELSQIDCSTATATVVIAENGHHQDNNSVKLPQKRESNGNEAPTKQLRSTTKQQHLDDQKKNKVMPESEFINEALLANYTVNINVLPPLSIKKRSTY